MVYNNMIDKGFKSCGQGLYTHASFIVDNSYIIKSEYQEMIKQYHYSKISKTPPFSSVQDTPSEYIDNFIIIEDEVNQMAEEQNKEKK